MSIRERIDINDKSIEDLKKFVEQDPDTTDYQEILNDLNSKARDVNTMSLDLKTRLLKALSNNPKLEVSIKQDYLQSVSQERSRILNETQNMQGNYVKNLEFGIFSPSVLGDSLMESTVRQSKLGGKHSLYQKSIKE
jgi:hypothetical protein